MPSDLMRINEVEADYEIPIDTLRGMRRDGRGPKSGRLAGRVVYRRADVEAWIEAELAATTSGGVTEAA